MLVSHPGAKSGMLKLFKTCIILIDRHTGLSPRPKRDNWHNMVPAGSGMQTTIPMPASSRQRLVYMIVTEAVFTSLSSKPSLGMGTF